MISVRVFLLPDPGPHDRDGPAREPGVLAAAGDLADPGGGRWVTTVPSWVLRSTPSWLAAWIIEPLQARIGNEYFEDGDCASTSRDRRR